MSHFSYVGDELHTFAAATTWKAYFGRRVRRHVKGDVLEVGARKQLTAPSKTMEEDRGS